MTPIVLWLLNWNNISMFGSNLWDPGQHHIDNWMKQMQGERVLSCLTILWVSITNGWDGVFMILSTDVFSNIIWNAIDVELKPLWMNTTIFCKVRGEKMIEFISTRVQWRLVALLGVLIGGEVGLGAKKSPCFFSLVFGSTTRAYDGATSKGSSSFSTSSVMSTAVVL